MTEQEWLRCTDPRTMLDYLSVTCVASPRKLRLFACACVRRIWNLLTDERSRKAVEVAESSVDEKFFHSTEEWRSAYGDVRAAAGELNGRVGWARTASDRSARRAEALAATAAAEVFQNSSVWGVATADQLAARGTASASAIAAKLAARARGIAGRPSGKKERKAQCRLLIDLFGPLPFRSLRHVDLHFLEWRGDIVQKLARAIYGEWRFGDMPILADALEEAGCSDADILTHCRSGDEHVRGCWVVDLLLGTE